jgi:hypothetical protein
MKTALPQRKPTHHRYQDKIVNSIIPENALS